MGYARNYYNFCQRKVTGFSLLELLCVLSIIAILTSISVSAWRVHIVRAHRLDGKMALLDLAVKIENKVAQHPATGYQGISLSSLQIPTLSPQGFYHLSIVRADSHEYLLAATPLAADKTCPVLALNSQGQRGILSHGTLQLDSSCW